MVTLQQVASPSLISMWGSSDVTGSIVPGLNWAEPGIGLSVRIAETVENLVTYDLHEIILRHQCVSID